MGMGFSPANNSAFINDAKILEMALYGGKDPLTGIKIGPQDGGMTTWKSYEEMIDAIVRRTHYHNKLFSEELNVIHLVRRLTFPTPYLSSMIKDCVKRGSSIIDHGAIYSPGGLGNYLGVANVGNSIAAIKKLVFEDKLFTLEQLKHALETNYEDTTTTPTGSEIQQRCLAVPKYGNDNDYVDKIVKDVLNMQADSMHQFRCLYGNIRSAGVIPVTAHIPFGVVTHATLDGRKSGTPLAEGCSPTQGTDVRGPTAAVRSVAKIDHVNLDAGTLYNLKLNPQSVEDESGMRKWMNLIRTYFDLGGHHIQFNVVTADTLRAAQKRPEKYRDLLVRVAGYSAFFVTMDKALQDDIIARTEHVL
jgi:formate C-acetyltransferase